MKRSKAKTAGVDAAKIHAAAMKHITAFMIRLLPDGQIHRKYWVARCPGHEGQQRPSLRVNLRTGSWTDFGTGQHDYDLVSLAKYIAHAAQATGRLIDPDAMFAPFSPEELAAAPKIPDDELRLPIIPVPADAPPMTYRHPVHGAYSQKWTYHDKNAGLAFYIRTLRLPACGRHNWERVLPHHLLRDRYGAALGGPEPSDTAPALPAACHL